MADNCPLQISSELSSLMFNCTLSPNVMLAGISGTGQSARRLAGTGNTGLFTTSYSVCLLAQPLNNRIRNELTRANVIFESIFHFFL